MGGRIYGVLCFEGKNKGVRNREGKNMNVKSGQFQFLVYQNTVARQRTKTSNPCLGREMKQEQESEGKETYCTEVVHFSLIEKNPYLQEKRKERRGKEKSW